MEQWCCTPLAFDSPGGEPGDEIPRQQPSGCCLLPVGRPASDVPMPGGGSQWCGEQRRTSLAQHTMGRQGDDAGSGAAAFDMPDRTP